MEGKNIEDLQIREEFKKLRGDFGIKKTVLEQHLEGNLEDMHRHLQSRPKPPDITHKFFSHKEVRP